MYRTAAPPPPLLSSSQTSYRSVSTLPPPFGSLESTLLQVLLGLLPKDRTAPSAGTARPWTTPRGSSVIQQWAGREWELRQRRAAGRQEGLAGRENRDVARGLLLVGPGAGAGDRV